MAAKFKKNMEEFQTRLDSVYFAFLEKVNANQRAKNEIVFDFEQLCQPFLQIHCIDAVCIAGSSASGMVGHSSCPDLDLIMFSADGEDSWIRRVEILQLLTEFLSREFGRAITLNLITGTRVPVLKFSVIRDGMKVEVDITVNNMESARTTLFFHALRRYEPAFRQLCWVVQKWVHANNLKGGHRSRFNSTAINALVLHFLQRAGVLPLCLRAARDRILALPRWALFYAPNVEAVIETIVGECGSNGRRRLCTSTASLVNDFFQDLAQINFFRQEVCFENGQPCMRARQDTVLHFDGEVGPNPYHLIIQNPVSQDVCSRSIQHAEFVQDFMNKIAQTHTELTQTKRLSVV